jgi:hypothetical protein
MITLDTIRELIASSLDDSTLRSVLRSVVDAPEAPAPAKATHTQAMPIVATAAPAQSPAKPRAMVRRGTGHIISPAETYCHTLLVPWLRSHPTVERMTAAEMLVAVPWPESLSVVTTPGRSLGGFLGALHARGAISSGGLYVESTSIVEGRPGDRRSVAYALRVEAV